MNIYGRHCRMLREGSANARREARTREGKQEMNAIRLNKKSKTPPLVKWREIRRYPVPGSTRVLAGYNGLMYAQAVWSVLEERLVLGVRETRERTEWTKPVYDHERPDLAALMRVVLAAMPELERACSRRGKQA